MVAEGDKVVLRTRLRATHTEEFGGIAPTGKRVTSTGMSIQRIVGGKVAEDWSVRDTLTAWRQLGFVPLTGQAGE